MGPKRILVVDDEPSIRTLLRDAISGPGVEIILAEDGERALDLAENQGPWELVVTDIYMPGMNGLELAGRLAKHGRAARFLFLSGYYDEAQFEMQLIHFQCAAFLEKPFSIPELLRLVWSLLAQDSGPRAGVDQSRWTA